ncbi:MAG: Hsp20/alpha crystallin family protein [Ktedonobacteraceae bacterium]
MANITPYRPFNEIVSLRDAMERLFEDSFIPRLGDGWSARGTLSNLHETTDEFVLQIPMPGVNPDEVEIAAQSDSLTIKWATNVQIPENATTHWSHFASGQYQQSFTLPSPIDVDKVQAHYEKGILMLKMPKAEHAKAHTIKVIAKQ